MAYGSPYSYEELKEKLLAFVKSNVKATRFSHTMQVVKKSQEYAERYGADAKKLEIAAIFHDAYRDAGNLEHAPLAAEHLEKDFGVTDPDILNAVRYHTTCRAGACETEKILKMADMLEDTRTYPEAAILRRQMTDDLDSSLLHLMNRIKVYVEGLGLTIAPESQECIEWLEDIIKNKSTVPNIKVSDKEKKMTNKELALYIAKTLDAKKAQDIVILDIAEKSGFADYFVIADAPNSRLVEALADETEDKMAQAGETLHHKEGVGDSGWVLLDFGDIIVNLFTKQQRDHYNIEKVWADCSSVEFAPERK